MGTAQRIVSNFPTNSNLQYANDNWVPSVPHFLNNGVNQSMPSYDYPSVAPSLPPLPTIPVESRSPAQSIGGHGYVRGSSQTVADVRYSPMQRGIVNQPTQSTL